MGFGWLLFLIECRLCSGLLLRQRTRGRPAGSQADWSPVDFSQLEASAGTTLIKSSAALADIILTKPTKQICHCQQRRAAGIQGTAVSQWFGWKRR